MNDSPVSAPRKDWPRKLLVPVLAFIGTLVLVTACFFVTRAIARDQHPPPPGLPTVAPAIEHSADSQLTPPYLAPIPPLRSATGRPGNSADKGAAKQGRSPQPGASVKPPSVTEPPNQNPQQRTPESESPPLLAPTKSKPTPYKPPYLAPTSKASVR